MPLKKGYQMKKIVLYSAILCLSFVLCGISDSTLYAKNKKKKVEKLQKNESQQKQDLKDIVKLHDKTSHELREYYNYTAKDNAEILEKMKILSEKLEERFAELEALSIYHDKQLAEIKDCIYKKYTDSSYCPFEYFARWFEESAEDSESNIERHSSQQSEIGN